MHKVFSALQVVLVVLLVSGAGFWVVRPAVFLPKTFAEPGISVQQYIERLQHGGTEWQRYNAAAALAELGDKSAVPYLVDALKSENESVRMNAVSALGELGAVEATEEVKRLLDDSSADVRANARNTLSQLQALETEVNDKALFYLKLFAPALIILAALITKAALYPRFKSRALVRYALLFSWFVGLVLAWFAQRPYLVSETRKAIGLPFQAAALNLESGTWVDYIGPLTTPLLGLDVLYCLFAPQVLLAALLLLLLTKEPERA